MKTQKNNSMLKYGGYASIMTTIVVIIAIVVNALAGQFNLKFDLTKNKIYTLSEDTISLLKSIDEEIVLYSVYEEGGEFSIVTEILDKYATYSKNITTTNVDPYKNPQFAAKYARNGDTISIGSVVVETVNGYRVVSQNELAEVVTNQATGESYMQGIKLESVLTGAIRSMVSGETTAIYSLVGHKEMAIHEELIREMEYGGYELFELNLMKSKSIPDDCSILLMNTPIEDITSDELKAINEYLDKGGSLFIALGIVIEDLPNFNSLLANYGVAVSQRMVIEGSADFVYQQNPYYVLPMLSDENIITSKLVENRTSGFIPFTLDIFMLDTKRSTVSISPFMSSSPYSYSKTILEMENFEKGENDPEGPFILGTSITDVDKNGKDNGVKIVVVGSGTLMESGINEMVNGGNYAIVMNSFDWLTDNDAALRSKSLGADDYLQLTQSNAMAVIFVSVILIPIMIIIAGLTVVLRRKNR